MTKYLFLALVGSWVTGVFCGAFLVCWAIRRDARILAKWDAWMRRKT